MSDTVSFIGTPNFGIPDVVDINMGSTGMYAGDTIDLTTPSVGSVNIPQYNSFSSLDDIIITLDDEKISYKYAEDRIISDFKAYIDKTYSEHYKTEQQNIECFDAWIALDDATPTFRNTALKYLWRYGKKNGSNKNDLMKALHYTLMCLYNDHYKDGK